MHTNVLNQTLRQDAVRKIIQFGYQFQCMDQTIMQAIQLGDIYVSQNDRVTPLMLNIVYTVALQISIKMNEDVLLAFADLVILFDH